MKGSTFSFFLVFGVLTILSSIKLYNSSFFKKPQSILATSDITVDTSLNMSSISRVSRHVVKKVLAIEQSEVRVSLRVLLAPRWLNRINDTRVPVLEFDEA